MSVLLDGDHVNDVLFPSEASVYVRCASLSVLRGDVAANGVRRLMLLLLLFTVCCKDVICSTRINKFNRLFCKIIARSLRVSTYN